MFLKELGDAVKESGRKNFQILDQKHRSGQMLVNNTKDSMLIKMVQYDDNDNEHMISAYYCTAPFDQLQIYQFCKEQEIDICFNDEKYFIDNIVVGFGDSDGTVPTIKVVVS